MVTFVDSSALYAFLDVADANHARAKATMTELLAAEGDLVTHNYVIVETSALIQRRLGAEAVRVLLDDVLPAIRTIWIDEPIHRQATAAMIGSLGRGVSLVDWTSFSVMRERGIGRAFAFDADFETQGFLLVAGR